MPYGFYISAEGANAQSARMDVIANNLANVDTVGFKRELASFQARYAEGINKGLATPGAGRLEDVGGGVFVRETKTDFSQGAVKRTNNPAHLAIAGDGFFTIKKGNENFLTRAGNFEINSRGELVTPQGYSVLDESGAPVVINPEVKQWNISDEGVMRQSGSQQALAIVKPAGSETLVKYGDNLYRAPARTDLVLPADRHVAPGCLEMSAVSPTTEMTAMIEASRLFEANITLMQTQDRMLGSLVTQVLKA
jgi:flagellar basal-body rod protein FlgF